MKLAKINPDFNQLLTDTYCGDMAQSHIDCWKERYQGMSKKKVEFDLRMNHDDSLEIDRVKEDLGRELTHEEETALSSKFHKKIVQLIR